MCGKDSITDGMNKHLMGLGADGGRRVHTLGRVSYYVALMILACFAIYPPYLHIESVAVFTITRVVQSTTHIPLAIYDWPQARHLGICIVL